MIALLPHAEILLRMPLMPFSHESLLRGVSTPTHIVSCSEGHPVGTEPFCRTVYVWRKDDALATLIGYYDGDDPVDGLPGISARDLLGHCPGVDQYDGQWYPLDKDGQRFGSGFDTVGAAADTAVAAFVEGQYDGVLRGAETPAADR